MDQQAKLTAQLPASLPTCACPAQRCRCEGGGLQPDPPTSIETEKSTRDTSQPKAHALLLSIKASIAEIHKAITAIKVQLDCLTSTVEFMTSVQQIHITIHEHAGTISDQLTSIGEQLYDLPRQVNDLRHGWDARQTLLLLRRPM
jgi:hypothetical protein